MRPNDRIFDIPMVRSVSHSNGLIQFLLVPELENLSQNLRVGASKRSRQNYDVDTFVTPPERFYPTRTGFANKLSISKFTRRSDRIYPRTQTSYRAQHAPQMVWPNSHHVRRYGPIKPGCLWSIISGNTLQTNPKPNIKS